MNTDLLHNIPIKKLNKLPDVVSRLIGSQYQFNWNGYSHKMSPRKLLFGLYIMYREKCNEVRGYKKEVAGLKENINKLCDRISELKEYEKMVVYRDYTAIVTTFHWDCGSGCCSDSWCGYVIKNSFGMIEKEEGAGGERTYRDLHRTVEEIKEIYGDIHIQYDADYSQSS